MSPYCGMSYRSNCRYSNRKCRWRGSENLVPHARNLADYHATAEDIKDPDKLHLLTRRILHSWHLTGSEYRQMEDHLDSFKFKEWQKTERYLNLVLAGLWESS